MRWRFGLVARTSLIEKLLPFATHAISFFGGHIVLYLLFALLSGEVRVLDRLDIRVASFRLRLFKIRDVGLLVIRGELFFLLLDA